ncbi:transcription factor A, mitochondrial isoform X2 [Leptopilina boulardi]|nr:transcription factor A, mitochondrial isoform X2 [Leptopilina boulardi]
MKEIVRIVSEKWANYPIEKKEEMKQNALEDFKRYRENYQNYKTSLTDEQLKKLEEAKDKIKLKKTNLKLKNKKKELDKPKRPSSAYNSFCRDRYFKLDESVPFKERMILLAQQWKNEDAEVKKKYRDDYLEKMTVYNEILKEWEQKMVELGHFDMIGSNKLRKLHKQFQKKAKL